MEFVLYPVSARVSWRALEQKKKKKKVVLSKHAFNKIILEVMHKIILKGEEPEGRMLR